MFGGYPKFAWLDFFWFGPHAWFQRKRCSRQRHLCGYMWRAHVMRALHDGVCHPESDSRWEISRGFWKIIWNTRRSFDTSWLVPTEYSENSAVWPVWVCYVWAWGASKILCLRARALKGAPKPWSREGRPLSWKRREGPHPQTFDDLSKKIARFTKGRFRPYLTRRNPFRTKNTTALNSVVFTTAIVFYYFCSDLLLKFPSKIVASRCPP